MPVVLVSILQSSNCYCYDDGIDQDEHVTEMLSVVLTGMWSLALTSRRSKNETRQKSTIDLNRYHHHRQRCALCRYVQLKKEAASLSSERESTGNGAVLFRVWHCIVHSRFANLMRKESAEHTQHAAFVKGGMSVQIKNTVQNYVQL